MTRHFAVYGTLNARRAVKRPHNSGVYVKRAAYAILASVAALTFSACNRQNLVAKATATDMYFQQHYTWACVDVVGPVSCGPCQMAVNDAAKLVPLANAVYKIGALPDKEVAELKALIKRLEACP